MLKKINPKKTNKHTTHLTTFRVTALKGKPNICQNVCVLINEQTKQKKNKQNTGQMERRLSLTSSPLICSTLQCVYGIKTLCAVRLEETN